MFKKILSIIMTLTITCILSFGVSAAPDFRHSYKTDDANVQNSAYAADDIVTFIIEVDGDPTLASEQAQRFGASAYAETKEAKTAEARNLRTQKSVLSGIQSNVAPAAEKGYTYTTLFNGFSMEGKFGEREAILSLPGVKNVYVSKIRFIPEPRLTSATGLTGVPQMLESFDFRGEGQVIAVIDSEFDTGHVFFSSPVSNPKYDKADIEKIISENTLNVDVAANQVYKNSKIPFAYDYVNHSSDTYNSNPDVVHGSHVAGIVAGKNGTAPGGKSFSGVAPEAQLILMKASNAQGNLPDSAVLAALDDAAKFGVSAINMSFGSDYLPTSYDLNYGAVLDTARNAGIFLSVAAGNAARGYKSSVPLAENIDYAAAGTPNSFSSATAIASVDNTQQYVTLGTLSFGGQSINYADAYPGSGFDGALGGKDYEYVYCGLGKTSDFSRIDLNGKLALVKRGEINFTEKADNAKKAGAVGLVLWNNADAYLATTELSLPAAVIRSSDGSALIASEAKTLRASAPSLMQIPLENAGKSSGFTSWGTSETLELKPELSAPGGQIYSSVPDNKYQTFDGTSMAAPHVTGLTALMNQYYETNPFAENYNGLAGRDRVSLFENLLMSSAVITKQASGIPESPRRQGAGLANVKNAMTTPVILLGDCGKSKISLGDEIGSSFTLTFTARNLTEQAVTYDKLSLDVLTDGYETVDGQNYVGPMVRLSATSDVPQSVTVPAGGEQKITIHVTLDPAALAANAEIFKNGFYIDGFVSLTAQDNSSYAVSIPFTGFHGNWRSAPLFDTTMYDEGGSTLFIPYDENSKGTYLYGHLSKDTAGYLGKNLFSKEDITDKAYIAISPNGDGVFDDVNLKIQPLRAMSEISVSVADTDGNPALADMVITESTPKFYESDLNLPELSELPNGEYTLTFQGRYDYSGREEGYDDTMSLPLTIDTQKPIITGVSLDANETKLTITALDNSYLSAITIGYPAVSGEETWDVETFDPLADGTSEDAASATFDITGIDPDAIKIEVYDFAMNCEAGELLDYSEDIRVSLTDFQQLAGMTLVGLDLTNRSDTAVEGVLLTAFYDDDGRMVQLLTNNTTIQPGTQPVEIKSFEDTTNAAKMKVMLWNGFGGMQPLFTGKTFNIQ